MSLSYVDFAETSEPECEARQTNTNLSPEDKGLKQGKTYNNDNFPVKLHYMLDEIERDSLNHIVSWQTHGRCFAVHSKKEFEETLLPKYVFLFALPLQNKMYLVLI